MADNPIMPLYIPGNALPLAYNICHHAVKAAFSNEYKMTVSTMAEREPP